MKCATKTKWRHLAIGLLSGMALMWSGQWAFDRYQEYREWSRINLTHRYKGGQTALHLAVADWNMPPSTKLRKIRFLIRRGADVNATNHNGETPLHLAHRPADLKTMRILLAAGADPNAQDAANITPLFWAGQRGTREQAELLIRSGADVNAPDDFGLTPLHQAVFVGNTGMVQCLLSHGADPCFATRDGDTPREEAAIRYPGMLPLFYQFESNPPSPHRLAAIQPGTFQAVTPDGKPYDPGEPVPFGDGSTMFSYGHP